MLSAELLQNIVDLVGAIDETAIRSVGGGSINHSYKIPARDGSVYFLKTNHASALAMFEAERAGLCELGRAKAVRVPEAVASATVGNTAFLLMEYLDLSRSTGPGGSRLGSLLAKQHHYRGERYGWCRDNTIGSTPQLNGWEDDWITFFCDKRLGYQVDLAVANGFRTIRERAAALMQRLPDFFVDYDPEPSLLHGDLWGGNWGTIAEEQPVIFDPAVYYGDREADIAMTRLFGGFGPEFFRAYNEAWCLDRGFERRCGLYNLYHVLNHLNMFGEGYLHRVSDMLDSLLA